MLEEILAYLNNWFVRRIIHGNIKIENGELTGFGDYLAEGQYFRVIGSLFNDGVYKYPADDMTDEEFDGAVWALAIPADLLALVEEIEDWSAEFGSSVTSPYTSESFGGYSYSKATAAADSDSSVITWYDIFGARLARWRKI